MACANAWRMPASRIGSVRGVCVGLPGVVEHQTGLCRQSAVFGERNVPFAAELQRRLGLPVSIDSDVNLVTLAEAWFGEARGLDDFLVVSLEGSLGLGIMHKGELFRGAGGLGPDLGDFVVRPTGQRRGAALRRRLRARHPGRGAGAARDERAGPGGRPVDMARITALAADGHPGMRDILATAGEALGFAIANLVALFAPPKVILVGGAGPALLGPLRDAVARLVPPSLANLAEIVEHRWADETWARGAAAMTLQDLYGAPWSTTGPARTR